MLHWNLQITLKLLHFYLVHIIVYYGGYTEAEEPKSSEKVAGNIHTTYLRRYVRIFSLTHELNHALKYYISILFSL